MGNTTKSSKQSFPFFGILALIFITLKLMGYIAWSWWWVLAPLWLPVTLLIGFAGICMVFIGILDKIKS